MISWAPWEGVASRLATKDARSGAALRTRFVVRHHGTLFWIALWVGGRGGRDARAPARPVRPRRADPGDRGRLHARRWLVRRLRVDRLAPAARQPQRDADDRDRLPVLRVAAAEPARRRARGHDAGAAGRPLDLPVRRADPDAADERPAATRSRPAARGLVRDPARDRRDRVDDDRSRRGPPAARVPRRRRRARDRQDPARHARVPLRGDGRRGRDQVVESVGAAASRAAAEPRRRLRAAVLRRAAGQRPRRPARGRRRCCGSPRARSWPCRSRSSPVCCARGSRAAA